MPYPRLRELDFRTPFPHPRERYVQAPPGAAVWTAMRPVGDIPCEQQMIAEGSSSSSQTPMPRGGSPQGPSERDLLAERRARRLAESGESALTRRAEVAEATVRTLEAHVATLQRRLRETESEGQRAAALAERVEHIERALATIRESHRRMAATVAELKTLAAQLRTAIESHPTPTPAPSALAHAPAPPRSEEMADALAAAVERLRARAQAGEAAAGETAAGDAPTREPPAGAIPTGDAAAGEISPGDAAAREIPAGEAAAGETAAREAHAGEAAAGALPTSGATAAPPSVMRPAHKHSMSLIGRLRLRRKQRRKGR